MTLNETSVREIINAENSQQIKKLLLLNDLKSLKAAYYSSTFEGTDNNGMKIFSMMLGEIKNFFVINPDGILVTITEDASVTLSLSKGLPE